LIPTVVSYVAGDSPNRGTPSGWRGRLCLLPTSSSLTHIIHSLQPTIFDFGGHYFRTAISDCVCLTPFVGGSGIIVSRPRTSCAMRLPSTQGDLKRLAQMKILRSASRTDATNRCRSCARLTTILLPQPTLMAVNGNTPAPRFSEPGSRENLLAAGASYSCNTRLSAIEIPSGSQSLDLERVTHDIEW
jgi:hypothetical protein